MTLALQFSPEATWAIIVVALAAGGWLIRRPSEKTPANDLRTKPYDQEETPQ